EGGRGRYNVADACAEVLDAWVDGREWLIVHVETECKAPCIENLRGLAHLVIASALHVAKQALEPEAAIEAGPARQLHRALHRSDGGVGDEGAPDKDLAGRLGVHRALRRGVEHVTERQSRGR